jgi:hypothetical protein
MPSAEEFIKLELYSIQVLLGNIVPFVISADAHFKDLARAVSRAS